MVQYGRCDMADSRDTSKQWIKTTVPLSASHKWQCKAGNELFVADRGAVAFEFPRGWVVQNNQVDTITLHNAPPPADEARIALTIFRLPPVAGGWGQLPLDELMLASQKAQEPKEPLKVQS